MDEALPPGQLATRRFPVIGERVSEPFDPTTWRLVVEGAVENPLSLSFDALAELPRTELRGTVHCVTRWSRPDSCFAGVPLTALFELARPTPEARFVRFASGRGHDTTLPLDLAGDVLVATELELAGTFEPLPARHGGPVRSVCLSRYFYKSVKWLRTIELLNRDRLGTWERTAGYHNGADPWKEERYVSRGLDRNALRRRLTSRDLAGLDLLGADLSGVDLAGATLRSASLRNAHLDGADLRDADLRDASCCNASLRGADLRGARIDGLDLDGADLSGADLRGAVGVPGFLVCTQFGDPDGGDLADLSGLDWRRCPVSHVTPEQRALLPRGSVLLPPPGS